MRNFITLILILLIQSVAFSQADIAIIKDPDGYINIRKGQESIFKLLILFLKMTFSNVIFLKIQTGLK